MTFGEKLRSARLFRKMTQSELAGEEITRNMLSRLENDQAAPSMATLKYLAARLDIPCGYFIDDISEFDARKLGSIQKLRKLFKDREYSACEELCTGLGSESECLSDCEISLILAECRFRRAVTEFESGNLTAAKATLESVIACCEATVYDTSVIYTAAKLMYDAALSVGNDREALPEATEKLSGLLYEIELWSSGREVHNSRHELLSEAKTLYAEGNCKEAAERLKSLYEESVSVPEKYRLLTMLEACMSKAGDFESAYKCARQKLELLSEIK